MSGAPAPARLRSGTITNDDYPLEAIRAGAEGSVHLLVAVGVDGRVAGVRVERSSGHEALDSVTCAIVVRRFRYAPAEDGSGNPIESEVRQTVTWRLDEEEDEAPPPEPAGPPEPPEPPSAPPAAQSEVERAYRALLRWDEERLKPFVDSLAADFAARLAAIEAPPGPGLEQAADAATIEIGRLFDERQEDLVRAAVSYLDDDILRGLQALGARDAFGAVIWDAVDEARDLLRARIWEARGRAGG